MDSASGIHPRYSQFYFRTVRADKKDPLAQMMRAQGFPVEDEQFKPESMDVFYFPVKGPGHAVFRNDMTAVEQLEHYLMFKESWCEHNPSITVYVRDAEWLEVGHWVYKNFNLVGGISFLPHSDHIYPQSPYTQVTEDQYNDLLAKMPEADWGALKDFEFDDSSINFKELSCVAGVCEIL